jgi:hypothetical protein
VCAVLEQYGARPVADGAAGGIADAALGLIAEHTLADTFYLYDLGEVSRPQHTASCVCSVRHCFVCSDPLSVSVLTSSHVHFLSPAQPPA